MAPLIPIGAAIAEGIVSGLLLDTFHRLGKLIAPDGWRDADELTRLFLLVESTWGEEIEGFKHGLLGRTLGNDEAFLEVYDRLSRGTPPTAAEAQAEHDALVSTIEPFVTATTEKTQHQLAEEVASFLPYLIPEAKDENGRVLYELRQLTGLVEAGFEDVGSRLDRMNQALATRTATLILSSDWPEAAADALKAAREADSPGLAQLDEALRGKDRAVELPVLVRAQPDWMAGLSHEVWELISILCEEHGLWEEAQTSWLTARGRPGADYAGCSVRAAEVAATAFDDVRANALLDEARHADPSHPRVMLHDALGSEDPREALRAVDAIEPRDTSTAALLHVVRASLHASLRDLDAAQESLDAAAQAGAGSMASYRLVQGTVALAEVMREPHVSTQRIAQLVESSLSLEGELRKRKKLTQAAQAREHAVGFYALTGDYGRARTLLAEAADIYASVDPAEPRLVIAMGAAQMESYELVRRLVRPEDTNARAALLRALVGSDGTEDEQRAAVVELDGLLDNEHEPIRVYAAIDRLVLAGKAPGIEWSEQAEGIVAATNVPMAVAFKAYWFERTGRTDEAERELLGHSDETWAIRELMKLAGRNEDWAKAAARADALLRRDVDWVSQFSAADAFRLAGEGERAKEEFTKLADAEGAPSELRAAAYSRLASQLIVAQDFGSALALTEKWLELAPEDVDARWMKVGTLGTLGRDREAHSALERWELHPRTHNEYVIAAQLRIAIAEPADALREVIALADEHNPPSERMEALVVRAAIRARSGIPPDLADRAADSRFFELFPESKELQKQPMEVVRQFLAEAAPEQARRVQDAIEHVFTIGDMPSVVLAPLTNSDIGGVWMRLAEGHGLPLGYSDPVLDELDRRAAQAAFGGPVLWDATSIFVVDHVLDDLTEVIRTAFPNGRITQAALMELTHAARTLAYEESAGVSRIGPEDPQPHQGDDTQPEAETQERLAQEAAAHAADEQRAQSALEFAHKLNPVPNTDAANPQSEDEQLNEETSLPLQAVYATYGTARRLGLAIYSDDRDIRRRAHLAGLPAFGTVAALQVLEEKSVITDAVHLSSRRTLLQKRGLGIRLTGRELIPIAEASDWELTRELAVALSDPFQWRGNAPALSVFTWMEFLYALYQAEPEKLKLWVARFLTAIRDAAPRAPLHRPAQLLLAMSFLIYEPDATLFARALIRAIDGSRQYCSGWLGDPAGMALLSLKQAVSLPKYSRPRATAVLLHAWTMLPFSDQVRLAPLIFG